MAEKKKTKKLSVSDIGVTMVEQDTLQKLTSHMRENPLLYAAVAGFVVLCVIAGLLYRLGAGIEDRKLMTEYARAVEDSMTKPGKPASAKPAEKDPKEIMAALSGVAEKKSRWNPELFYLLGETAIRAEDYAKAEESFKKVCSDYPASEYAPRATAGLAFLAENKGDLDAALAGYKSVMEKWPNSFEARCQPLNIARVLEAKSDFKGAADSYQSQINGFPKSNIASKAEEALARLHETHADLFPAKEAEKPAEADKTDKAGESAVNKEGGTAAAPAPAEAPKP